MKHFLFIPVFITVVFSTYGQSTDSGNIIDGVSIAEHCDTDTTINFYSNAEFTWIDSVGGSSTYKFSAGDLTYLEISIKKKCKAKDGSSHEIIIVEISSPDTADVIKLDSTNTTWLIRNTWRYNPFETNFSGTLDFNNHTLTLNPKPDPDRNVLLDGKMIKNELLTKLKTN